MVVRKKTGVKTVDPIKTTKAIRQKIREVKCGRVFQDSYLLTGCKLKNKWRRQRIGTVWGKLR